MSDSPAGVTLSFGDGATLHERVAAGLRRTLRDEEVQPGMELPTAGQVAEHLGVNVNTALRAYRALASEGLVELRRGHGPRVLQPPEMVRVHELANELAREAARQGLSRGELVALVLDHG